MKRINYPQALNYIWPTLLLATLITTATAAELPVELGTAGNFAALAGTTVTNTGASTFSGDIGVSPGSAVTGFPPGVTSGAIHAADVVAAQAQADLLIAYNDAFDRSNAPTGLAGDIGGTTLAPGLYKANTSLEITISDLTLDALGDPNAVFIFQIGTTLTTTSGRGVILAGGAKADNIFWQVGSSATIGTGSAMQGNILAATSITVTTGATLNGRALAINGAVTIDTNTFVPISTPAIDKIIIATSVAETSDTQVQPGLADLTIGEEALFQLTITLDEGLSPSVVVTDYLPSIPGAGVLEIIPTSTTVVSIGANLFPATLNPLPNIQDSNAPFGFDDTVEFSFGGVINTPDGFLTPGDQIVINVGARVVDLPDNFSSSTLINRAQVLTDSPSTGPVGIVLTPFDIVEPDLSIDKAASDLLPQNGSTVTFQTTITHSGASAADAFDLVIDDLLTSSLNLVVGSVSASTGTIVSGNTLGDTQVTVGLAHHALNDAPVTISYEAIVTGSLAQTDLTTNTVTLDYDSLPTAGNPNERAYQTSDTATVEILSSNAAVGIDDFGAITAPGGTVNYTVSFSNIGDNDLTGVTITHIVPEHTTFNSGASTPGWNLTPDDAAGSVATFIAGNLDIAATSSLILALNVDTPLTSDVLQISAEVSITDDGASGPDVNLTDNDADEQTPVVLSPALSITKTDTLTDTDGTGNFTTNDTLTYTVAITNTGDTILDETAFIDLLDSNLSLTTGSVSASQGTVIQGNGTSDTFVMVLSGLLTADATTTVTFDVTLNEGLTSATLFVVNQGVAASDQISFIFSDDPDTLLPDDATITPIGFNPVLSATKRDSLLLDADLSGGPTAGDILQYEVVINNTGTTSALNVVFSDTPGSNTVLVSGLVTADPPTTITLGNGLGDTSVQVDIAELRADASTTITFRVQIEDPLPGGTTFVQNQGLAASDENTTGVLTDDPDTIPVLDPTATPLQGNPLLDASKSDTLLLDADSSGNASPGDTLSYTILITNAGDASANNVVFSDVPGSNMTLIVGSVTTSAGTIDSGNTLGDSTVEVTIGQITNGPLTPIRPSGDPILDILAAVGLATITFDVTINNPVPAGVTQVANQGTVSSTELPDIDTDDPDTGPVDDATVTPIQVSAQLETDKSDTLLIDNNNDGTAGAGDTLHYTISIRSTGNTALTNVVFTDTPGQHTSLVAGSVVTTGTVTSGNGVGDTDVAVTIGTLPAGDQRIVEFDALIAASLPQNVTQVENQGLVTANGGFSVPTNDPATLAVDDPTVTLLEAGVNQAFFAEGDVRGDFETYVLVVNPSPTDAAFYQMVFYFEDREPLVVDDLAFPQVRKSYNIRQLFIEHNELPGAFGLKIETTQGAPFYAERSMYWNPGGVQRSAGTASASAPRLSTEWFLAEGTTKTNRETQVLIANPGDQAANLRVTWLLDSGVPVVVDLTCPAERRLTLDAEDYVGINNFSVHVESLNAQGVVIERTMYGPADGISRKWGHNVMGSPAVSSSWFFAEGAVHATFETFLLLGNPNTFTVDVTVRYLNNDEPPVTQLLALAAQSRTTINVERLVPGMADRTFSIEVTAADNNEIVAERSMYWKAGSYTQRSGGTATAGATQSALNWYLPEGAIGGGSQFEEFILIGNTGANDANVRVTTIDAIGVATVVTQLTVPAGERRTVKLNDYFAISANTVSLSALIEATNGEPVIVERAMYWSTPDVYRIEGHASTGIRR